MKVALWLLVAVAVLARAQDMQYEQAVYSDAAAPAPFDQAPAPQQQDAAMDVQDESESDEVDAADESEESSFAEMDAADEALPGALTRAAKKSRRQVRSVRKLFNKRKSKGGNISPSKKSRWANRRPVPPPKRGNGKPGSAPASGSSSSSKPKTVSQKRANRIILGGPGSIRQLKKPAPKPKKTRPIISKRAAAGGKASKKLRPRPRSRRPISVPKPPAAARGFVDTMWHSERHTPAGSENRDPEMAKLNLALEAVKENILLTNKQINDERRWVIAVSKIIASYNTKMKRVEAHIIALRKEMKALYRKKKQIENLKLQKALEAKLKEAKAELATLTNSLKHVAVKQGELNKSGRDLRLTIAGIQGQLAKLRGQQMFKKCKPGTKYSKKAKKCKSVCKKGAVYSKKSKKCVARCKKGSKWNSKTRKCIRKSKGKKSKKSKKAKKF